MAQSAFVLLLICQIILSQGNIIDSCGAACICNHGESCTISCDSAKECKSSTINAASATDVTINCNAEEACFNANINCGTTSFCIINCDLAGNHYQSCNTMLLNCGTSHCILNCGGTDDCRDISIPDISNALSFTCNGNGCTSLLNNAEFTHNPSISPSTSPSIAPTSSPTIAPSTSPILPPSTAPTNKPSNSPTLQPTFPSNMPTVDPTTIPTPFPTNRPTTMPTTSIPTKLPTLIPSKLPTATNNPTTYDPTIQHTSVPSMWPTTEPTTMPTNEPTVNPTIEPTTQPTMEPTMEPTKTDIISDEYITTLFLNNSNDNNQWTWAMFGIETLEGIIMGSGIIILCASIWCCLCIRCYFRKKRVRTLKTLSKKVSAIKKRKRSNFSSMFSSNFSPPPPQKVSSHGSVEEDDETELDESLSSSSSPSAPSSNSSSKSSKSVLSSNSSDQKVIRDIIQMNMEGTLPTDGNNDNESLYDPALKETNGFDDAKSIMSIIEFHNRIQRFVDDINEDSGIDGGNDNATAPPSMTSTGNLQNKYPSISKISLPTMRSQTVKSPTLPAI